MPRDRPNPWTDLSEFMRTRLRLILTLAAKDWSIFWSDRRAAALCFAVPIVLASAFGMIFHHGPGQTGSPKLPLCWASRILPCKKSSFSAIFAL